MAYLNWSFYHFAPIENLQELRQQFKQALRVGSNPEIKGTILLAHEGINGMLAGPEPAMGQFEVFLRGIPAFKEVYLKPSYSEKIPYRRTLVKVKRELIPVGDPTVKPWERTGKRLPPAQLKAWLDQGEDIVLVDTRNDYELNVGTFEGAADWKLRTSREFRQKLLEHKPQLEGKKVVMFCTGGIRCEKATAVALQEGLTDVYQLEGGILEYFRECGKAHYRGECFVFDQRTAVSEGLAESEYEFCYRCRHPLSPEDLSSPHYKLGVSCPYCPSVSEGLASA